MNNFANGMIQGFQRMAESQQRMMEVFVGGPLEDDDESVARKRGLQGLCLQTPNAYRTKFRRSESNSLLASGDSPSFPRTAGSGGRMRLRDVGRSEPRDGQQPQEEAAASWQHGARRLDSMEGTGPAPEEKDADRNSMPGRQYIGPLKIAGR